MSSIQSSTLILNTLYASSKNSTNTSFVFDNISLRTALGDIWENYTKFNISLVSAHSTFTPSDIGTSLYGGGAQSEGDRCLLIRMNGLPFNNNSYTITANGRSNKNNSAIINTFLFNRTQFNSQFFNGTSFTTFNKDVDIETIGLDYLRYDFNPPETTTAYPDVVFIFQITPVSDFKNDTIEQRIFR